MRMDSTDSAELLFVAGAAFVEVDGRCASGIVLPAFGGLGACAVLGGACAGLCGWAVDGSVFWLDDPSCGPGVDESVFRAALLACFSAFALFFSSALDSFAGSEGWLDSASTMMTGRAQQMM